MEEQIAQHFDAISQDYDKYKKKNWYYYKNLKSVLASHIPQNKNVLEIGCATGDLLAYLKPLRGVGIDVSKKMIELANNKYQTNQELIFLHKTIEEFEPQLNFDYIFLSDVIEHLEDPKSSLKETYKVMKHGTELIITMANPIWEPVLMIAEKLKMKMPEGPHNRISIKKIKQILHDLGVSEIKTDYRLLIPKSIPGISNWLNKTFYKLPLINKLGFIVVIKYKKQ